MSRLAFEKKVAACHPVKVAASTEHRAMLGPPHRYNSAAFLLTPGGPGERVIAMDLPQIGLPRSNIASWTWTWAVW
jgi:hypothetical protein